MTTTTTTEATLRLLAWLSPAFPTGGFAWSHGIEWAVESGDITDGATLGRWLDDVLRHGSGRNDAILLRHAHRAAMAPSRLADIAELALATAPARERRAESTGQGNAFLLASGAWNNDNLVALSDRAGDIPYAVAVGALTGAHGIAEDLVCAGFLQAFAANLISAAIRLVPLGQTAGLTVLAGLEPAIVDVTTATRTATLDDLGGACWRADLAATRHETQYTRLFRS